MKKIDKRACRKAAQEPVRVSVNNALLYIPDLQYVLRSMVRNISGKRLLVIWLIPVKAATTGNAAPRYVVFQGKDDFITLEYCEDGKTRWRTAKTKWMDNISRSSCAFLTKKDALRVIRFCDPKASVAFDALANLQYRIRTTQEEQRRIDSKKRLAAMGGVECIAGPYLLPVSERENPYGRLLHPLQD